MDPISVLAAACLALGALCGFFIAALFTVSQREALWDERDALRADTDRLTAKWLAALDRADGGGRRAAQYKRQRDHLIAVARATHPDGTDENSAALRDLLDAYDTFDLDSLPHEVDDKNATHG